MALDTSRSLFDPSDCQGLLRRIGQLSIGSQPEWGKMTVGQMLSHCAEIQEVSNGKDLVGTPFFVKLFKGMIRKMVVGDKQYPRSTRTHPQYRQTEHKDFETQKARLLAALQAAVTSNDGTGGSHPLFGHMTTAEQGWSAYKHLDYHLTQFGA